MISKFEIGQKIYRRTYEWRNDCFSPWIVVSIEKRSYIVEAVLDPTSTSNHRYCEKVSFVSAEKDCLSEKEFLDRQWIDKYAYKINNQFSYGNNFTVDQYKQIAKIIGYDWEKEKENGSKSS